MTAREAINATATVLSRLSPRDRAGILVILAGPFVSEERVRGQLSALLTDAVVAAANAKKSPPRAKGAV